jgi:hypothetical protein
MHWTMNVIDTIFILLPSNSMSLILLVTSSLQAWLCFVFETCIYIRLKYVGAFMNTVSYGMVREDQIRVFY